MSCDNIKYNCGFILPSSCVPYTGKSLLILQNHDDFPCDANINDVIKIIDRKLNCLLEDNDFTTLNVGCFTQINPITATPLILHQAEITEICNLEISLATLQQTVNNLDIGEMNIDINLQCLTSAGAPCLTPPSTYQLLAVLNVMINEICTIKTYLGI